MIVNWLIKIVRNMVCVRYMVNSPYLCLKLKSKDDFLKRQKHWVNVFRELIIDILLALYTTSQI